MQILLASLRKPPGRPTFPRPVEQEAAAPPQHILFQALEGMPRYVLYGDTHIIFLSPDARIFLSHLRMKYFQCWDPTHSSREYYYFFIYSPKYSTKAISFSSSETAREVIGDRRDMQQDQLSCAFLATSRLKQL